MTIGAAMIALTRDETGKGIVKFAIGSCLLAVGFASSSPAFQANPLFGKHFNELRHHLPEALEKVTRAMGG